MAETDHQVASDEATIRRCAKLVGTVALPAVEKPEDQISHALCANQSLMIYHAMMTWIEPDREFRQSIDEFRALQTGATGVSSHD